MPGIRCSAVLGGICLVLASPAATAGEALLATLEDTWVDGLSSTSPKGSDVRLGICPLAQYWIYVKFDVGALLGTVESAELRLTRFSGARPEEISAYRITDDTWSEATLTGVDRPEPTDPPNTAALAAGGLAAGYDYWTSAALTAAVREEAQGDGIVTLMLRENPAQMIDVRYYRSREAAVSAEMKPRLAVTVVLPEVDGVAVETSPASVSWAPVGSGARYDVAGGRLSAFAIDENTSAAQCLADDLAVTSWNDDRPDPPPGDGDYYLVRVQAGNSSGTWGYGPGRAERIVLACP